jgi:hypothetical protein
VAASLADPGLDALRVLGVRLAIQLLPLARIGQVDDQVAYRVEIERHASSVPNQAMGIDP